MKRRIPLLLALSSLAPLVHAQSNDWTSYNGDLAATRYSALSEINAGNVAKLRETCHFDTGETVPLQSGLVAVGGVLYFTTYQNTYAIDASTCAVRWKHNRPGGAPGLGVNRGLAYLDGKLFRGTGDAHLLAFDAASGKVLWDVPIGDTAKGESVPMAPLAWNGMVFVGNAGGDNFAVTGRVHALSAADGHELWRFNVVPESGPARATWKNLSASNPPTGGATWTSYSLDSAAGVLWVSTGNVAPDFQLSLHPGDNLYTTSVIALDAKSGKLLRYVQPVKKDFHDWDMTAPPVLVRTKGGRQIAAAAGKDGLLYGIDRSEVAPGKSSDAPLKILFSTPVTTRTNVDAPLKTDSETHFCPGVQGGTEWNGPALHPGTNLLLVNSVDWCASVQLADPATLKGKTGSAWAGSGDESHPFGRNDPKEMWGGWVTAVDADSGKVAWKYKSPTPMVAAITPTAGGLVFTGDLNGDVVALDVNKGTVLWRASTGAAMGGGVISYQSSGHQHIAAASGMSALNWPLPKVNARVVVYGLP